MLTLLLPLLLNGCGGNEKATTDTGTPSDTGTTNDTGSDSAEDEEDTDEVENESSRACSPRPKSKMKTYRPNFFQRMQDMESQACFLSQIETDLGSDGQVDDVTVYAAGGEMECDDDGNCIQTLPRYAIAWSQQNDTLYEPAIYMTRAIVEGIRRIESNEETIELSIVKNDSHSTATETIVRTYNRSGQILNESFSFNGSVQLEVENVWEGNNLIEQESIEYRFMGSDEATLRWQYDDQGRLLESSFLENGQDNRAVFAYDEEGRLSTITRTLDGQTWLSQSWTYDGEALVSRQISVSPFYLPNEAADNAVPVSPSDYESHWEYSTEMVIEENCTLPPLSPIHGYPDSETVYQLGWPKNDTPSLMGWAYGYTGYGWNYGATAWFGHGGIASIYGLPNVDAFTVVDATIDYQDGIMYREEVAISEATTQTTITRTRSFENGRITADEMLIDAEDETDVQNDAHRLVFQYDGYGHLTQRNLYQNEIHVHQSDWTYDQYGTLAGHSVQVAMPDAEEGELTTLSSLRQSFREIVSGSERLRETYNEGEWSVVDTYAWGEHPRGRFERQNDHFQVYDTEEELVSWGNGDWESPTYYQAQTSDEQSLLDTWESKDGSVEQTLLYTHNCAE